MEIKKRFFHDPKVSFFLFGPRGTGKSTWIKMHFKKALYIDLLSPDLFRIYSARPERLKELIDGHPEKNTVVIDEVQKVPSLLDVVHQVLEQRKNLRFVLTGSSARKLKRTGIDLLAGRVLIKTLHPFMASEIGREFNLKDAVRLGLLPLVLNSKTSGEVLSSYASLYLHEEVQAEGLVRNIGNFARFLEAISFSHASVLNTSEVARECEVERKIVEGYISVLEDLLLCFRIPVFRKRAKRHLTTHPKFYFFDAGVFRSLRPSGPLDNPQEIDGSALEGLVGQHLRAWNAYTGEKHQLFFWRTKAGNEVDLILYGPDSFWAIEVKNSGNLRPKDIRGLLSFKQDYPQANTLLLYRGREKLKRKGVLCLPCEEFLKTLTPGKPIC